ncbi:DNA methyltransferase [uncultured Gilvimarinus sp.]|uniref:DNA methyltransferase n=1 Tax=uncultured Gilvimarinus sp. TaxID=1689143 RepID=UPI0030EF73A9
MIELLNVNCMDYMRDLPDNSFDLVVADPPYFDGPNKPGFYRNGEYSSTLAPAGKYGELKHWDVPGPEFFAEIKRISQHQIVWGANHLADRYECAGPGWIVWDKQNGSSSFADAELASTTFDKAVRIFQYRWNGMIQGSHGNKRLNETRIHPTQKPVILYKWLYENYAQPGWRILDTHLGSASSAIAAHYCELDFVGTEIDSDQFRKSSKRFTAETKQIDIFSERVTA